MKHIQNEDPFLAITEEPFRISLDGLEAKEASLADVIALCVNSHQQQQGQTLSIGDYRTLNKALEVFEAGPNENGQFALEDTDYAMIKKVLEWSAPIQLRRNSPHLLDALEPVEVKAKE